MIKFNVAGWDWYSLCDLARVLGLICTMQILHNLLTTASEQLDDLDNDLSDLSEA